MGKRGFISANNALFVSVDLIGEKNQVILELELLYSNLVKNGWILSYTAKLTQATAHQDRSIIAETFWVSHKVCLSKRIEIINVDLSVLKTQVLIFVVLKFNFVSIKIPGTNSRPSCRHIRPEPDFTDDILLSFFDS